MKFKKLFVCLFAFSLFLSSCSNKTKDNSNSTVENTKETKDETVDGVVLDEEIKNIEIPKNAVDFRFLNYNSENNKLYFTYASDNAIVYASKNLKDDTTDVIYEIKGNEKENMFVIAKDGVIDETLYILKVNNKNVINDKQDNVTNREGLEYNLITVDKNKNIKKYLNEDEYYTSADNQVYNKVPSVMVDGRDLILTCENKVGNEILKSYLLKFNIDDVNLKLIKEEELNIKDNKLNGNYIMFAGGIDNETYCQIINYNNETQMEKGSASIFKFTSEDASKKVLELDKVTEPETVKNRKILFVSGDNNLLFTSEYVIEASNYNTGKVFTLSDIKSTEIPNVTSGNDLINLYKINDLYLLYNNENIYIYNKTGKLLLQKVYDDKTKSVSEVSVTKNCISFLVKEKEDSTDAKLHILKLKAK